ncbi:hypothetical protein [Flavobacterium aquicola]|uniref:Uncharacterized protein n=1 Tax=Flavobacterium aquicola TaxID=1682742 RepID=A0A3E0EQN9_9FLAO|nr:hypothetical protein [Flavobacterium aquicola]REH00502.1 hypothetical protein C8P67_103488 [Flavobacterium aquicola]
MANRLITAMENNSIIENPKEITVQHSTVKYREETLGYNEVINQVDQEYYHKIQGCSVKEHQQFG